MQTLIRRLEACSFSAWPALTTRAYAGWTVRMSNGVTRRANSINPIFGHHSDIDDQMNTCESLLAEAKLPVIYKMTDAVIPGDLDDRLTHRGYAKTDTVDVQSCQLDGKTFADDPSVSVKPYLSQAWETAFTRLRDGDESGLAPDRVTRRLMLEGIGLPAAYVTLHDDNDLVACGRAVYDAVNMDQPTVGLYDIIVSADHRRQGWGRRVTAALLAWGQSNGAQTAYLQVHSENDPALRLYASLGFETAYTYWYRAKS